ncbi:hypothetical protein V6N13_079037 [Hibiscus sabdariffa]
MLEELTTNAQQIQDHLLCEILGRNAGTEYLRRFLHGQTHKQLLETNVPIVAYEHLKPYIHRIANGEASLDVLLAEPVAGTGTSGGQPKLIPFTSETTNKTAIFNNLYRSVMLKHFGDINQVGKRMELMFVKPEVETPSSLKASAVSTRSFKGSGFRAILPKLYTSPFEAIICLDAKQSIYCQLLCGLIQRDEVVMIGSVFASGVLRASVILKPNPELADLIENLCSCKSWEGIIRKLWPRTKYIGTICTGAMIQYTAELEFYCGGIPLVSETKSSDGDTEPVELVNVKPGQCYELLITSSTGLYRYRVGDILMVTGFHNNTPQFRFVGRENVALGVDVERTSEADLLKAMTEAKTLVDPLGFILTRYTSYGDTCSTPGHYVIFWELKAKEGNNGKELDPKVMEECCSGIEDL